MACVDSAFKISAWQNYNDLGYYYSIQAFQDTQDYDDNCRSLPENCKDLPEYRKILSEILNKKVC